MSRESVIIHVDMDAFFAAVEQRDRPALRGKPVVVGADPKEGRGRGVVSTCSYEAREFGVHSAQPISEAWRRCPHAVFLPVRMAAYVEASRAIRGIFEEFTPEVEPVSIDEAFLDVTRSLHLFGDKRLLAETLQARIEKSTQLTASLGVAPCKLVAKIASDLEKPRGLVVVEPGQIESFLFPLPVGKLWGVGSKTRQRLDGLGIHTIGQLAARDQEELKGLFGKASGEHLWKLAHGQDDRPVEAADETKSIGHEHTFPRDISDRRRLLATLMELSERVAHRLRQAGLAGRTVTTKIRFEDFTTLTRATTVPEPPAAAARIYQLAAANLGRVDMARRKVRLIGVSVSRFGQPGGQQLTLFDQQDREEAAKERQIGEAIDAIKTRFGHDALHQARTLERAETEEEEDEGEE